MLSWRWKTAKTAAGWLAELTLELAEAAGKLVWG